MFKLLKKWPYIQAVFIRGLLLKNNDDEKKIMNGGLYLHGAILAQVRSQLAFIFMKNQY
jgi:hypothetical protein